MFKSSIFVINLPFLLQKKIRVIKINNMEVMTKTMRIMSKKIKGWRCRVWKGMLGNIPLTRATLEIKQVWIMRIGVTLLILPVIIWARILTDRIFIVFVILFVIIVVTYLYSFLRRFWNNKSKTLRHKILKWIQLESSS